VPACKAFLVEGDAEMDKYHLRFQSQKRRGYVLLCRTRAYSDLRSSLKTSTTCWNRVSQTAEVMVSEISMLTHDIRRLVLKLVDPPEFAWITGQYVEITIPGTDETCSYSFQCRDQRPCRSRRRAGIHDQALRGWKDVDPF